MKTKQKPYVGQHVYWRADRLDDPLPAIVTYVGSDIVVNVCMFQRDGMPLALQNINYWDGKGPRPTSRVVSEE